MVTGVGMATTIGVLKGVGRITDTTTMARVGAGVIMDTIAITDTMVIMAITDIDLSAVDTD